jgi:hypothetical protein
MSNSIFRNAFSRLTAAREKQARRYVDNVLLGMDDETLKSLGHNREALSRRNSTYYPF